jgi:hypothetical protein
MASEKHELAYVVLDLQGVHLYRHGDPTPEHIPLDKLYRVAVSLRDVAGPCVWVETAPEEKPSSKVKGGKAEDGGGG